MSPKFALCISATLLFVSCGAIAQDRPITVFFEPCKDPQLNDAITTALTQTPFVLQMKYQPGALIVAIPDKVTTDHLKVSGITWTFTVAFSRNGDSLGQSVESCNEHKLADCADQLASDTKSAAGLAQ